MMIKRYSEWEAINEVDELVEFVPTGKYFNSIVDTYAKNPGVRPSRDVSKFQNAKSTPPLSTFVKGLSGKTYAQIIESLINNWYRWPNESEAKNVIMSYIKNEDDLANLAAFGVPFGKVVLADPTIFSFGSVGKSAVKTAGTVGKKLFGWIPKLLRISESSVPINEGGALAAIGGFVLKSGIAALLSASTRYVLYGKESLEDDLFFSWTTPYLPDIKGVVGDDPIIATYISTFNSVMMIVYDSWNLCMGQDKYGNEPNPILSWQSKPNYITYFYKEFYESDDEIRENFKKFMSDLQSACKQDMNRPSMFEKCPFYYTGDKIRINYDDGKSDSVAVQDWFNWVRDNYKKYMIVPVSATEFNLIERTEGFMPLRKLGINEEIKGDPMREVTMQFPDGSITKMSVLQ